MVTRVSRSEIVSTLKVIVSEIVGDVPADEIAEDVQLFMRSNDANDLGLDSLDGVKLALAVAAEYGLDPDLEIDHRRFVTIGQIAEYVHALVSAEV